MTYTAIYNTANVYTPHCLGNDSINFAFVPIFKNASSWGRDYFKYGCNMDKSYNWLVDDMSNHSFIVFLRDPIERWLTGISTYFMNNHKDYFITDDKVFDMIFDGVTFDVHTAPQTLFIESLDTDRTYFFNLDDNNFINSLRKFVTKNSIGNPGHLPAFNITKEGTYQHKMQEIFRDKLYNNKKYMDNIQWRLRGDIELIKKIRFENE